MPSRSSRCGLTVAVAAVLALLGCQTTNGSAGTQDRADIRDAPDAGTLPDALDAPDTPDATDAMDLGAAPDVWVPVCDPEEYFWIDFERDDEFGRDSACAGNVGCTELVCEACTRSCTLCDGERCLEEVDDDSCLVVSRFGEVLGEPARGVVATVPEATFTFVFSHCCGPVAVLLSAGADAPTAGVWSDAEGVVHTRTLVPPVTKVADRVLLFGESLFYNRCTGVQDTTRAEPALWEASADGADFSAEGIADFYAVGWRFAWIRVYEDAAGARVFRWFEPNREVGAGDAETTLDVPALVTEPFPADVAEPLSPEWDSFDWAAALR